MGRRALRQGGGDGGAQLRHVNMRRTEEPADREGFIFPENPREKKQGSKNTHSFRPERVPSRTLSTCDTTTLLPLYYTTLLPTPPCTDTVRKKVAADFNRVSAVVIPKPFDF